MSNAHRISARVFSVTVALAIAALAALIGGQAQAGTVYWDGSGTGWDATASWSTASDATTPDPDTVPGSGDDAVFNITTVNTAQIVNLNADQAINSLTFNSTGTVALQGGGTNWTLRTGTGDRQRQPHPQ
jgi:hypothetical protein